MTSTANTPRRAGGILRTLFTLMGIASLVLGVLSTGWLALMAGQWALPWSSLAVMAPPGGPPPGNEAPPLD